MYTVNAINPNNKLRWVKLSMGYILGSHFQIVALIFVRMDEACMCPPLQQPEIHEQCANVKY